LELKKRDENATNPTPKKEAKLQQMQFLKKGKNGKGNG
jgi:hypothetical protein